MRRRLVDWLRGQEPLDGPTGWRDRDVDVARAARALEIRCRREASGLFTGQYASAFRGRGMEFDELRPYVPGDDVRRLDWNALARTGVPHVERHREERDRMLLLALDTSAPMAFAGTGPSLAEHGAHALGLLATAAARAGDRIGFLPAGAEAELRRDPLRGRAHAATVVRAATRAALDLGATHDPRRAPHGLDVDALADTLLRAAAPRSAVFIASSFRGVAPGALRALAPLAEKHAVVALVLYDRADATLPRAGRLRLAATPGAGARARTDLDTAALATRSAYEEAFALHRRTLEHGLRSVGCDTLWLRADHDPLAALTHFFTGRGRPRPAR